MRLAALALIALLLPACSRIVVLHDPLGPAEHNDLGVAYESRGRLDLAEKEYRRALRQDRRFAAAWLNLGNVAAARGRWQAAEARYRRALRHAPADGDALNNLAVALLRRGRRLEEAEALALQATRSAAGTSRDSLYRGTLEEVREALRNRSVRGSSPR